MIYDGERDDMNLMTTNTAPSPLAPVVVPPTPNSPGLRDLTVLIDPNSAAELRQLATTGRLSEGGSIDLGLRALFGQEGQAEWRDYPKIEGATEQLAHFYLEAGKQALTLLDMNNDGVVNLQTEAPGLLALAERSGLPFDLDGDAAMNANELATMLYVMSLYRENGIDFLDTDFLDGSTTNWRINNSTMYNVVNEDGSLGQGGLSMDHLDYGQIAQTIMAHTKTVGMIDAEGMEKVFRNIAIQHPHLNVDEWDIIYQTRFPVTGDQ
jgi:hypothetical protein